MRSLYASLFALGSLAACGSDDGAGSVCATPASAPLPTTGELIHPDQLPLPDVCVAGGLVDLPGRWFVVDPDRTFTFSYPRYEGSCSAGFRNAAAPPDDADESDDRTRHTWTDGTRLFTRTWRRFAFGDTVFERVSAQVTCMTADGTLAWAWGGFDTDNGPSSGTGTGTRFGLLDEPAKGLTRVGGLGPDTPIVGYNVVVEGVIAYLVGPGGLHMIDVSTPSAPRHLSTVNGRLPGFNDVRVVVGRDRVVAFASPISDDVTSVFDVTDPAAPVRLANIPEYSHSVQVRVDGARTLLYLATYESSVPIYDVTDPTLPRRIAAPVVPGPEAGIHDLTADGDLIYANNTTAGMVVIDVSAGLDQPAVERGRIPTTYSHASWTATIGGKRIVIHGDEGMTPDGGAFMRILDGDPGSPSFLRELSRYRTRPEVGIHNMMIVGDKAYVAYYQDGVRVIDLADPTQPREVAHYNTWDEDTAPGGAFEGALGARVAGGLIYVADSSLGLLILRETP